MASAFGFTTFPVAPSPDPRAVGAALARAQTPVAPATPGPSPAAPALPSDLDPRDRLRILFRALTTQAGRERGGPGQTGTGSAPPGQPDYPVADHAAHSAMHASLGDAAQRIANGVMAPADMGAARKADRLRHLQSLGVSAFEADLLSRSGGI